MTPYRQLCFHDPDNGQVGDCLRTAIGCLLDLPPEAVPHFSAALWEDQDDEAVISAFRKWLTERHGLTLFQVAIIHPGGPEEFGLKEMLEWCKTVNPGMYMILSGQSLPGLNHALIVLDGEIVHDPNPLGRDPALIGPMHPGDEWLLNVLVKSAEA